MIELCWRVNVPSVVPTMLVGHYIIRDIKHVPSVAWGLRLWRVAIGFLEATHPLPRKDIVSICPLMSLLLAIRKREVVNKKSDTVLKVV